MAIHSREGLDKHLEQNRPGFWGGLWLLIKIAGRFVISLGPQNWSLTRLASSEQKIQPSEGASGEAIRNEGNVLK